MEYKEFLPCPFCGEDKFRIDRDDYNNWTVYCECGSSITWESNNRSDAVDIWNHRTPIKTEPCPYCDERFWTWDSEYYNNPDDAYMLFKNKFCPECGRKIGI